MPMVIIIYYLLCCLIFADWQPKMESQTLSNLAEAEAALARKIESVRAYTPSTYIPGVGEPPSARRPQDDIQSEEESDVSTEEEQEMAMLDGSLDFEEGPSS